MVFDLTFEEAMDVLKNRLGWVQGEKFEKHEYLTIDKRRGCLIKNTVEGNQIGYMDYWGDHTREAWINEKDIQDEIKAQRYRFILVFNKDSVKGTGIYQKGEDRNSYLWYKQMKEMETTRY